MASSAPFSKLPSRSRADQVRDQLEAAIRAGDYPVGSKLPSERELTEMFGVSRVSVREGIRSLEAIGLVEVRHGNGCFVIEQNSTGAAELAHWLDDHRDEVLEMLIVRGALDELAAAQAADRGREEDLAKVVAAHEAFLSEAHRSEGIRLDDLVRLDIAFHVSIAEASRSGLLIDLLGELHEHLAEARRAGFEPEGRVTKAVHEHSDIVEALSNHDSAAARSAVVTHIAQVYEVLEQLDR